MQEPRDGSTNVPRTGCGRQRIVLLLLCVSVVNMSDLVGHVRILNRIFEVRQIFESHCNVRLSSYSCA